MKTFSWGHVFYPEYSSPVFTKFLSSALCNAGKVLQLSKNTQREGTDGPTTTINYRIVKFTAARESWVRRLCPLEISDSRLPPPLTCALPPSGFPLLQMGRGLAGFIYFISNFISFRIKKKKKKNGGGSVNLSAPSNSLCFRSHRRRD